MMTRGANELLQYFYATCILLVPVFCGLERTCPPSVKERPPRGTCGSHLTSLLSVVCMLRGGYNKRSIKRSQDQGQKHHYPMSETEIDHSFKDGVNSGKQRTFEEQMISKREAYSFLVKKSEYNEQGVVCECCYFPCSMREMAEYCAANDLLDFYKRGSQSADNSFENSKIINKKNTIENDRDEKITIGDGDLGDSDPEKQIELLTSKLTD